MARAGELLWNRQRITVNASPATTVIDTGLTQVNRSFGSAPSLGVEIASPGPSSGALPVSRIMVVPLVPTASWATITHGEPFLNPATGTVCVAFAASGAQITDLNVLFWDPHSAIGPGRADTYGPSGGGGGSSSPG